jgi:hypothetical protein
MVNLFVKTAFAANETTSSSGIVEALNTLIPGGLENLFVFAWEIGGAIAFVIILWAGVQMVIHANDVGTRVKAKEMITEATWGLGILAISYLIISIINPSLLEFKINLLKISLPVNSGGPQGFEGGRSGGAGASRNWGETEEQSSAVLTLKQNDVDIYSSGSCSLISGSNCTSLAGFPESAVAQIINFNKVCKEFDSGCHITITGGTEVGHISHGAGLPVFDISQNNNSLNSYLATVWKFSKNTDIGPCYNFISGPFSGGKIIKESDHFHVDLSKGC